MDEDYPESNFDESSLPDLPLEDAVAQELTDDQGGRDDSLVKSRSFVSRESELRQIGIINIKYSAWKR